MIDLVAATPADARLGQVTNERLAELIAAGVPVIDIRRPAEWSATGVIAGTVERRESEISLPGIQSASQAQREAIERLNKLTLADLSFSIDVFDEGLKIEPGDVVAVSHPLGLVEKGMRVGGIDNTGPGRWTLQLIEYDPAAYSDAVVSNPSTPDTSLPSPIAPTAKLPSAAPAYCAVVMAPVHVATSVGLRPASAHQ